MKKNRIFMKIKTWNWGWVLLLSFTPITVTRLKIYLTKVRHDILRPVNTPTHTQCVLTHTTKLHVSFNIQSRLPLRCLNIRTYTAACSSCDDVELHSGCNWDTVGQHLHSFDTRQRLPPRRNALYSSIYESNNQHYSR